MKLGMQNSLVSIQIHSIPNSVRNLLKQKCLKIGGSGLRQKSALGAGGRAFKSPRPDQLNQIDATSSKKALCGTVRKPQLQFPLHSSPQISGSVWKRLFSMQSEFWAISGRHRLA